MREGPTSLQVLELIENLSAEAFAVNALLHQVYGDKGTVDLFHAQAPLATSMIYRALWLNVTRILMGVLDGPPRGSDPGWNGPTTLSRLIGTLRREGLDDAAVRSPIEAPEFRASESTVRTQRNKLLMHFDLKSLSSENLTPVGVDDLDRLCEGVGQALRAASVVLRNGTGTAYPWISIGNQGLAYGALAKRAERYRRLSELARGSAVSDSDIRRLVSNLTDREDESILGSALASVSRAMASTQIVAQQQG